MHSTLVEKAVNRKEYSFNEFIKNYEYFHTLRKMS